MMQANTIVMFIYYASTYFRTFDYTWNATYSVCWPRKYAHWGYINQIFVPRQKMSAYHIYTYSLLFVSLLLKHVPNFEMLTLLPADTIVLSSYLMYRMQHAGTISICLSVQSKDWNIYLEKSQYVNCIILIRIMSVVQSVTDKRCGLERNAKLTEIG